MTNNQINPKIEAGMLKALKVSAGLSDIKPISIPYGDMPYTNFYQYPPPEKVSHHKKRSLVKRLCLDDKMSEPRVFTIFVSIPYCRSHCNSCTFFKALLPRDVDQYSFLDDYLKSIIIQINMYGSTIRFSSARCCAVYIGGGTPSLLAPDQVAQLIKAIKSSFSIDKHIEITIEVNPKDISRRYLKNIKNAGINRLSIGFQSSQHNILKHKIKSPHNGFLSIAALKNALEVGFKTVNVDLLYGVPGQTLENWKYDLDTVHKFNPESITIYPYVIHSNSAAEKMIICGNLEKPPDPNIMHGWYLLAVEQMRRLGYTEQRKGNFFKQGHEQIYAKLTYMQTCELVGIGAGAYSFVNKYLFKASNDPKLFKEDIRNNLLQTGDYQSTQATERDMMIRYIIHNILLLNRKDFYNRFGNDPLAVFPWIFDKLQGYNFATCNKQYIKLTNAGKRWISNILYEFYSEKLGNISNV